MGLGAGAAPAGVSSGLGSPSGFRPISAGLGLRKNTANGAAATTTIMPSRNHTVRQPTSTESPHTMPDESMTPIRYAAKGMVSRPPMDVPHDANAAALLRLRWNHRTTRASMLVIDAALRQVLITMENTAMNHSRSNGICTNPRFNTASRSVMKARLIIAQPMTTRPIPNTFRGPYLSNSAPMIGCIAPLMRNPTEPTHEISARFQPKVGSISVTNRPKPCRPGMDRNATKKQVATMYHPKYKDPPTCAADLVVISPLAASVPH